MQTQNLNQAVGDFSLHLLNEEEMQNTEGGLAPIAIPLIIKGVGIGFAACAAAIAAVAAGMEMAKK